MEELEGLPETVEDAVKRVCNNCRFWKQRNSPFMGFCRFHAPVMSDVADDWPTTESDDLCGDFQYR